MSATPTIAMRIWRSLAIGLLLGIVAHALFSHRREIPATVTLARGMELPAPDPRLDQILDHVDFDNAKLSDALTGMVGRTGMNLVEVWEPRENQDSITADSPVTLHLKNITLAAALDTLLQAVEKNTDLLRWSESGGVITVTTKGSQKADATYIRFYDLMPLVKKDPIPAGSDPNAERQNRTDELCKFISDNADPASWKDNGGDVGSISRFGDTIIVTQTASAHHRIESLLRQLQAPNSVTLDPREPAPPAPDPRLNQILDHVDFDRAKLGDALNSLAGKTGISLIVMWEPMKTQSGIQADLPVTLHLKNITMAAALDTLLQTVEKYTDELRWSESAGVVTVTTRDAQKANQTYIRVYDLKPILIKRASRGTATVEQSPIEELVKVITDNVIPTSWISNGGNIGTVSHFGDLIIITQTAQAHLQIEALLRKLQEQP